MDRHKGRQKALFCDDKLGGVRLVDVDGVEMEAPEIELIAHLQRGQQVLLYSGGVLVVFDLLDLPLHRVHAGTAVFRVKCLGSDGEKGRIERQRLMDLIPGDAEGHHDVGHGVGLGEQVADFGQRLNVPVRYIVLHHGLLPALIEAALLHLALSHLLHDLEAHFGVKALGDQVQHNIVTAAHSFQNAGGAAEDQLPGIAHPHVRTVGEAGEPHQRIEILGLGVNQHLAGEPGVELRDGHGASWPQNRVILIAQHLAGNENGHGLRVIQGDLVGVHPGEVLHHAHHSGVIVSQHIQLQDIGLHGVVFKMGGDGIGIVGVCRVLHRAEILHVLVVRHYHQSAGVLAGGAAHTHAAKGQSVFLRPAGHDAVFLQIFLHKAVGRLFRQSTDGACPEHLGLTEHLNGVAVGPGLVFAGEVQVDIRHLAAAEAQEGLKGNVKSVLHVFGAADGTHLVRHIRAAAVAAVQNEFAVFALRTAVVGRQGVDLRNAGHISHQRRADGAS